MAANFPFARSVVVVRSEVTEKKIDKTTRDTRDYLSSREPAERTPRQWQALVRGHWSGRQHGVRLLPVTPWPHARQL